MLKWSDQKVTPDQKTAVQRAVRILESIPETYDMLKRARRASLKVIPRDMSADGYFGLYDAGQIYLDVVNLEKNMREYKNLDFTLDIFASALADTLAHELKHFDQDQHVSFGDLQGTRLKTKRTRDIVMGSHVLEADAYAFEDFIMAEAPMVLDLLNEGLTPKSIRTQLRQQQRDINNPAARLEAFKKNLKDLDDYTADYIKASQQTAFFTPDRSPLEQAPPVSSLCASFRKVVGEVDYLANVSDRDLTRLLLSSISDKHRPAIWAVDAYYYAAERPAKKGADQKSIHLFRLRTKALKANAP